MSELADFKLPDGFDGHCPHCGVDLSGAMATDSDSSGPTIGSLMLCMYCGIIAVYGTDGLTLPLAESLDVILAQPEVKHIVFGRALMVARGEVPTVEEAKRQNAEDEARNGRG